MPGQNAEGLNGFKSLLLGASAARYEHTGLEVDEVELLLVRHAHPDDPQNLELRRDPGLSARGRGEAEAVADRLGHQSWDALYTSPQRRSLETAAAIADALALEPHVEPGLAEFDYGQPYIHLEDLMVPGTR